MWGIPVLWLLLVSHELPFLFLDCDFLVFATGHFLVACQLPTCNEQLKVVNLILDVSGVHQQLFTLFFRS